MSKHFTLIVLFILSITTVFAQDKIVVKGKLVNAKSGRGVENVNFILW